MERVFVTFFSSDYLHVTVVCGRSCSAYLFVTELLTMCDCARERSSSGVRHGFCQRAHCGNTDCMTGITGRVKDSGACPLITSTRVLTARVKLARSRPL